MKIVVTGGLGYIGSWVTRTLLEAGHQVGIIDNQSTAAVGPSALVDADVMVASIESTPAHKFIRRFSPDVVMHLAASTLVGEGESKPFDYGENNVGAAATFLKAVLAAGCRRIVHAGSCAVYGSPKYFPVDESFPTTPMSWYGWTKLMVEEMLRRAALYGDIKCAALRYFNVIGPSLGKFPDNLLFPRVIKAASSGAELVVNGKEYPTKDGTCVRDYVDVRDVAEAHVAAAEWLAGDSGNAWEAINIGSGQGLSVLEILAAIEKVSSTKIKTSFGPSRPGDVSQVFANITKAAEVLGWQPKRKIEESAKDAWDLIAPKAVSHES